MLFAAVGRLPPRLKKSARALYSGQNGRNFAPLASLVGLAILLCGALLLYPSLHARYLFKQLETLQLGRSTFKDADRLARKIHAEPYGACDRSYCEWDKQIDNASLPRWWRGSSGVGFSVSFTVKDSLVVRKDTGFGIGLLGSIHPSQVELEEQEHCLGNHSNPAIEKWPKTLAPTGGN